VKLQFAVFSIFLINNVENSCADSYIYIVETISQESLMNRKFKTTAFLFLFLKKVVVFNIIA